MNRQVFAKILFLLCVSATATLFANRSETQAAQKTTLRPASPASWQVLGPGGGGGIFKPTVSPHDSNLVLTHCDMTGAYISENGGDSWRMFFTWNLPTDFEFDPLNTNVIYTATRGFLWSEERGFGTSLLLRSSDRGKTWKIVYPDLSQADTAVPLLQSRETQPSQFIKGGIDGSIDKVEADPRDNRKIYLGMSPLASYMSRGDELPTRSAMLVFSGDRGASWRQVADLPGVSVLGIFPGLATSQPSEVLAYTERTGALVDVEKGTLTLLPLPVDRISCAEYGKGKDGTLVYVLAPLSRRNGQVHGGVFVSRDLGRNWKRVNEGLFYGVPDSEAPRIRGLAVCETAPGVAYLSSANSGGVQTKEGGWYYGIFKTVDSGENWKPVWLADGHGYLTKNHEGSWLDKISTRVNRERFTGAPMVAACSMARRRASPGRWRIS